MMISRPALIINRSSLAQMKHTLRFEALSLGVGARCPARDGVCMGGETVGGKHYAWNRYCISLLYPSRCWLWALKPEE